MTYSSILARSFSKHEQKKLGYGAFLSCFIIVLTLCTVFKNYLGTFKVLNLQLSIGSAGFKMRMTTEETTIPQPLYLNTKLIKPVCDMTSPKSDVCEIVNQDVRIHGSSSTIFIASTNIPQENNSWTVRPYARKTDNTAMGRVNPLTIKLADQASQILPSCTKNYSIPGIIFSTGGFGGNTFHAFSDILIPLYVTSRKFQGEVQFLVTDMHSWWINLYKDLLKNLSKYNVIDLDRENEVLCFSSMIVGIKAHEELTIHPSDSPYSMTNFTQLLRTTYSLKRQRSIIGLSPRLLIISRNRTRRITNVNEVSDMARSLGFEVVVKETTPNVTHVSNLVNSFDVMMGVHGAGLTNMVYLPENAIVIQIIPFGGFEWLARTDYEAPTQGMKLRYLEYKISVNESSLIKKFPPDHQVLTNPDAIKKRGYGYFKKVYMDSQDVELDVHKFRHTLLKALELF